MIGEVGKGYKYAIESLNVGRIGIGAQVNARMRREGMCCNHTADAGSSQRLYGECATLHP